MTTLSRLGVCLLAGLAGLRAAEQTGAAKALGALPVVGEVWTVPVVGIPMRPIAAGEFEMGSPMAREWEKDQQPVHTVVISRPFWTGEHEVTIGEYLVFLRTVAKPPGGVALDDPECPIRRTEAGYELSQKRLGRSERQPMTCISWSATQPFCTWLAEQESKAGCLPEGYTYRLPTEAEWEYCCRAGSTEEYPGNPEETAWYGDNSGKTTHEVATKKANPWGLCDMMGNVREWCLDWSAPYPSGRVVDPLPPRQHPYFKVLRGAGFTGGRAACRAAIRWRVEPDKPGGGWGFRIVLAPALAERSQ
jgi:formylglycine-generating enzyme required for sulfatase activity